MEDKTTILESLADSAENYGKSSIELMKLKAIRTISETVSSLVADLAIVVITVLFIFILSIGLSLWIGDYLGKPYMGFFVVAGVYLLVTIIFLAGRKQLVKTPVSNSIIRHILN